MAEAFEMISASPMCNATAAHRTEAKRTNPHFRRFGGIGLDALLAPRESASSVRRDANASISDCLIKACVDPSMERPALSRQFDDDVIHRCGHAHISVVGAADGGLYRPAVRPVDGARGANFLAI